MNGLFIAVDGPGGAGKSTLVRRLAERLETAGYPVTATTEPSGSALGDFIRHRTHHYEGPALACLVAADRYQHLSTEIRPALAQGRVVLCDRYLASSLLLQRLDGVPEEFITDVNAHADLPDLNILLTGDPRRLRNRIELRGSHGRFEDTPEHTAREVDLLPATAEHLRRLGIEVLSIDTTTSPMESALSRIAAVVERLRSPGIHPLM